MKKFLKRIGSPLRKDRKSNEEERKKNLKKRTSGLTLGVLGARYFRANSNHGHSVTPTYIMSSDSMQNRTSFKNLEENGKQSKDDSVERTRKVVEQTRKVKTLGRKESVPPPSPPPSPPAAVQKLNRIPTKDIVVTDSEKDLLDCSESMVNWLNDSSKNLPSLTNSGRLAIYRKIGKEETPKKES